MDITEGEKKLYNTPRISKKFLFLFLFLFAACFFMRSFVAPLHKEAELIKLEIAVKEKNIESKKLWLLRAIELNKKNKINIEGIEKINSLIPHRNNYEDYLAHIIKIAGDKNIIISGFSISENKRKSEKSKLNNIKISLLASGGYSNFISFLEDIERSIPFMQIESVSASATGEGSQDIVENKDLAGSIINFSAELSFNYY